MTFDPTNHLGNNTVHFLPTFRQNFKKITSVDKSVWKWTLSCNVLEVGLALSKCLVLSPLTSNSPSGRLPLENNPTGSKV